MHDLVYDVVETLREPLLVLDGRLRVHLANRAFYRWTWGSFSQSSKPFTPGALAQKVAEVLSAGAASNI